MEVGKENQTAIVRQRTKPTFVTIGKRQVISTGHWNNDLMAEYVLLHGREKWLTIGELARVAYSNGSPRTKERTRQCIHKLVRTLLDRYHELLVVEYSPPNNRATAVKLYDHGLEADQQAFEIRLKRMRQRSVLSVSQYETALLILREKASPIY